MPQPIESGKPSMAAHYGRGAGNILNLILGLRERKKRKEQQASEAQQQFLTNIIRATYNSGQIGPLEAEEAYKKVQAGEGLPEIMEGLKAPQKAQDLTYKEKLGLQEGKEKRIASYKDALRREPKMKQWIDSWKDLHKMPGTTNPYTGAGVPYNMWPEGINQMRLSLEGKMGKIDSDWMSYTLPSPEIERPQERGTGERALGTFGINTASKETLESRKNYIRDILKEAGASDEEIESKLTSPEDINYWFDKIGEK